MPAPTIYNHADTNGPGYVYNTVHWLKILKACLVDGYTGKAAAGWSLFYDDIGIDTATSVVAGTKAIFKSASGDTIFMIEPLTDSAYDAAYKLSFCEQAFTDGTVSGTVSGEKHDGYPAGDPEHCYIPRNALTNWIIAATGETFFLNSKSTNWTYSVNPSSSWNTSLSLYVGKFKDPRPGIDSRASSILIGGRRTTGSSSQASALWDGYTGLMTLRGLNGAALYGQYDMKLDGPNHGSYFNGVGPIYQFYSCHIGLADENLAQSSGGTYNAGALCVIGELFGIKKILFLENSYYLQDFLQAADPALAAENCYVTPITLGGKQCYRLETTHGLLLSADPLDWE